MLPIPTCPVAARLRWPRLLSLAAGLLVTLHSSFSLSLRAAPESTVPPRTSLWQGVAPVGATQTEAGDAFITVHHPAQTNGTAIIICPGGGYGGLVTDGEGHGIARWLGRHGITGIVLEYRLPQGRSEVPLADARQAIRFTRAHAQAWGVRTDRIGIVGFSAGGHLAATASTLFDLGDPQSSQPLARVSSRPDFAILVYPVVSMGTLGHGGSRANLLGGNPSPALIERFSAEKQVGKDTPPAYLAHAVDDQAVSVDNARLYFNALQPYQGRSRLLELPSGGHGLNGYRGPMWDAWQTGSLVWLTELGFLPADATPAKP
jgi:acetyl esterase/lipase